MDNFNFCAVFHARDYSGSKIQTTGEFELRTSYMQEQLPDPLNRKAQFATFRYVKLNLKLTVLNIKAVNKKNCTKYKS